MPRDARGEQHEAAEEEEQGGAPERPVGEGPDDAADRRGGREPGCGGPADGAATGLPDRPRRRAGGDDRQARGRRRVDVEPDPVDERRDREHGATAADRADDEPDDQAEDEGGDHAVTGTGAHWRALECLVYNDTTVE